MIVIRRIAVLAVDIPVVTIIGVCVLAARIGLAG